ncbi:hypothetical protein CJD36_016245 [Flavipsychrobacter stenotrophus]|uniref:Glycosyltransferase RgtA/B/C/D-like domain-containing protein n=1 Tax=Flavipsychrobacter stenotrophus TaxID=2077091 RepID=A0A2S7SU29_9BACT|nr:hypothetical protein [Flavipsychrobacter stenotrophus]PQJ10238.1 hypothetical protein CJD36_016245 [Flavipsychrobacter stenotrophus]
MNTINSKIQGAARVITLVSLLFLIVIGGIMVAVEIRPFWVDEWFIIYNLKTRAAGDMFTKLEFMQQFPRTYLASLKRFTAFFNYSYSSLRLPSYLVSLFSMALVWKVMKRIFEPAVYTRYLLTLVLISSFTFLKYYVEMKQYPMDILMSVVALWQLLELLEIDKIQTGFAMRYALLCQSFAVVPFFSYTYLLAIAPVYGVLFLQAISVIRSNADVGVKSKTLIRQWVPLIIGLASIATFYNIDVRQLATDAVMYDRWNFIMLDNNHKVLSFFMSAYSLFAQVGTGDLFENVFGVLGVVSFIAGAVQVIKGWLRKEQSLDIQLRLYSILVVCVALVLFLLKKLPLGTPRLNVFTVPSITLLIIYGINSLPVKWSKVQIAIASLLYLGLAGNVFVTYFNYFSSEEYGKQQKIYTNTTIAIQRAQSSRMPIFVLPGIAYPYETPVIDAGKPDPAIWVLQTFPAYNMQQQLPVYPIYPGKDLHDTWQKIGAGPDSALVGDGVDWRVMGR